MKQSYTRALALGTVCGLRAVLGPALVAKQAPASVQWALRLLSAGELIGDKLPKTPSRLALLPLSGRILSGAAVGYFVCREAGDSVWVGAALGAGAALAGSYGGYYGRRALGKTLHLPDPVVAVVEDVLAVGVGRRFGL